VNLSAIDASQAFGGYRSDMDFPDFGSNGVLDDAVVTVPGKPCRYDIILPVEAGVTGGPGPVGKLHSVLNAPRDCRLLEFNVPVFLCFPWIASLEVTLFSFGFGR
jgi:hypothetical protein